MPSSSHRPLCLPLSKRIASSPAALYRLGSLLLLLPKRKCGSLYGSFLPVIRTMGPNSKLVAGDGLDRSQDGGLKVPEPGGEGKADQMEQRQGRKAAPVNCPRCESTNTKFCYYNNYSKSQPRHFCRACRRHWTDGGSLRNVPVGGNRKNKRLKTAHGTSTAMDNNVVAQQRQTPLPPSDDKDGLSSIFQGIHGQVLLRPPPPPLPLDYRTVGSGFYPVPPFLPEFGTAEADLMSSTDSVLNPLSSISSSSCSSPYDCTNLDPMVGEDGIAAWQAPTPLPASNLSCWDDIRDLVNAQDSVLSTFP